jgi:catechol 2,3-dioxygenase-like lactoylglutathione lyase family enzyme
MLPVHAQLPRLHHVHLTLPVGGEPEARRFYGELLGLPEVPKPPELEGRGGVWFQLGDAQLHLGIEEMGPASRRHVALLTDNLQGLRRRLQAAGVESEEAISLEGMERFYCRDPFGNRLEIVEMTGGE